MKMIDSKTRVTNQSLLSGWLYGYSWTLSGSRAQRWGAETNQCEQAQRGGPDTPWQPFALRAYVGKAARQASCVMEMLLLEQD